MSVMKMKRVNICALRKNRKRILEALQRMGVMEIEAGKSDDAEFIGTAPQRAVFERRRKESEQALAVLDEFAPEKKSMLDALNGKKQISQESFDYVVKHQDDINSLCRKICGLKDNITANEARILKIDAELEALNPWLSCDVSMGLQKTASTDIIFGSLPSSASDTELTAALSEFSAQYEKISEDKNAKYIAVISVKHDTDAVMTALKKHGFARPAVNINDLPMSYRDSLLKMKATAENAIEAAKKQIRNYSGERFDIVRTADYYGIRADKYEVLGQLMHSKRTFFISGYVPEKYADKLCDLLIDKFDAAAETEDCDDYPVELENSTFAASFEPVLESYGLPKKHEIDPSTIMGIFYVFLFGLMLSDAAYGAIISIACFCILKKFKNMEDGMRKSIRMFMYCGLSTLFWGIMFGGYFGDAVTVISKNFFGNAVEIPALWFVPLNDPMRLLMYSMLFGLIHLFTGLGIKGYMYIRDRDIKGLIFDVVSWFMLLIGLLLILMESSIYASLAGSSLELGKAGDLIAKILAISGAVIILLTGGRSSKNPTKRLAKGAYSLYDITSWLSDLLSYSRLLALGLATGVIAQVVNSMGVMAGNGAVGFIVFVLVFVVGHTFNLAINLLGAYVHTNRLQYVEFFGKFYEGGGRKFNPFKENTKYIKIKED